MEPRAPRVQPPTPTVQAPAPRVPRILPTVVPVPQTVLPDPQPVAKRTRSREVPSLLQPATSSSDPVAHRTHSRAPGALSIHPAQASQQKYPKEHLALWCTPLPDLAAMPVLDKETGKPLEYRHLRDHPKYKDVRKNSYCNELGRLF